MVLKILGGVLVVWLAFILLGALIKGLFWLLVIGAVLFVGTSVYGAIRSRGDKQLR